MVTVAVGLTPVTPLVGTVVVTAGGASTVKLVESLAAMLRPASTSVTWVATTVTVQAMPPGRLAVGWSTNELAGEAGVTVKPFGVPTGHSRVKAVPVTLTSLLKLIVTVVAGSTPVAPL